MSILDNRFANRIEDRNLRELLKVIDDKNTSQDAAIALANGGTSPVTSVNGRAGAVVVTAADVGLEHVDDTADADKPVSTAQAAAIALKQTASAKGQANGYAGLDATGKVPQAQLPVSGDLSYHGTWNASTNTPTIPAAATGNKGWYYKVSTAGSADIDGISTWAVGDWIISNGTTWDRIVNSETVTSVAGKTGNVVLDQDDVGLDQVDNTSDADKPLSAAVILALADKEDAANKGTANGYASLGSDGRVPVSQLPAASAGVDMTALTCVFVNKNGNDTYDGDAPDKAVLTIGQALVVAAALISGGAANVTIVVVDAGTYTENVSLPANTSLWAPHATIVGTLILNAASSAKLHAIYAAVNDSVLVDTVNAVGEMSIVDIDDSDGRGLAGTVTGTVNFKNESSGRVLMARCRQVHVAQGGEGVRDGASSGFGHVHIEFNDLYLAGTNAKGIRTNNANTNIVGWIDHILEEGSHTGTIGVQLVDAGSTVKLSAAEIIADSVYDITAGSLYLNCQKQTGTKTGTPTWDNLTSVQQVSAKGAANGYASLDANGTVPVAQLPGQVKGINTQTANYQLVLADAGKIVEMNLAGANTLTIPTNATVAFPIGTIIDLVQYGAGQTTVGGAGVTIRSAGAKLKLSEQYATATLYKRGTDEWVLSGNLSA